jgi:hypothetical protein
MQTIDPIAQFPELKAAHAAMFVGTLKVGRRSVRVLSVEDASFAYQDMRDASGKGASQFRDGVLTIGANTYRVSYNGRVWDGDVVIFNPYGAA